MEHEMFIVTSNYEPDEIWRHPEQRSDLMAVRSRFHVKKFSRERAVARAVNPIVARVIPNILSQESFVPVRECSGTSGANGRQMLHDKPPEALESS